VAVIDLEFVLQSSEAPNLARTFRSPVPAIEAEKKRKPLGEFRDGDEFPPVVWQVQVREALPNHEIRMHDALLGSDR
jgi:hypothetical protein